MVMWTYLVSDLDPRIALHIVFENNVSKMYMIDRFN